MNFQEERLKLNCKCLRLNNKWRLSKLLTWKRSDSKRKLSRNKKKLLMMPKNKCWFRQRTRSEPKLKLRFLPMLNSKLKPKLMPRPRLRLNKPPKLLKRLLLKLKLRLMLKRPSLTRKLNNRKCNLLNKRRVKLKKQNNKLSKLNWNPSSVKKWTNSVLL